MTNRYTPFGYGVEDGAVITIQGEVTELRGIFQSYVSGMSLKKIAEELTERKVPYLPGKCQWNKNRVVRLLCDSRYVGADAFPAVISQEEFQQAQAVRGQNSTQKNCVHERVISEAAVPMLCGCCGSPAMRRQDRRTAYKQKWVCTNKQCSKHYLITDERLNHMIKELLTQADIETLDSAPVNSSELNRLENEIARLMEQAQPDGEALRMLILETAAKKYEAASHGRHITDRLRTDLQKANLSDFITRQQIMSIAKQITLLSDDAIQITLMNDQVIERENTMENKEKIIHELPQTIRSQERQGSSRPLRVAAYCRVSTDSDEQEMSFDAQCGYYTEKIMSNPQWMMAGIFADEGISGTQAGNRKEFMKMIRLCRQRKIDLVITKSVSRFARNTVDCLNYVRELKALEIPVIFEKEGLNTMNTASEIYISMHGIFAQSESESLSGNVRMCKAIAAKNGKVTISYKSFLGYRRGADGQPEIDPEQAKTVTFIYDRYLAGSSSGEIKRMLEEKGCLSPMGKQVWSIGTIDSILRNEKYKGDALLQKTYVADCISHRVKKNDDRPQYYVENNHPAIISKEKFDRVQAEIARRASKRKVKQKGTTTEKGKYSGKFALTDLLICGECGTPYRRCTWSRNGKKRVVWRCISRLDYGTKYCKNSPTIDEEPLHNAIANAIAELVAEHGVFPVENLKSHVTMYFGMNDENSIAADELRRQELTQAIMDAAGEDEPEKMDALISELNQVKASIAEKQSKQSRSDQAVGMIDEIMATIEELKDAPVKFDDQIARQLIDCIRVVDKDEIQIAFKGGLEKRKKLDM